MAKEKITLTERIKHVFISHPVLKLIALLLAIAVWFYVRDEINKFNY